MDPAMRSYLSYAWDFIEAYHKGMLSLNNSLNMLQLRMQEPRAPFEPVPTQDEFISYL